MGATQDTRQTVTAIVANIQRADYEGDRGALTQLRAELTPFVAHRELASRDSEGSGEELNFQRRVELLDAAAHEPATVERDGIISDDSGALRAGRVVAT
jgi:hypothetical protein